MAAILIAWNAHKGCVNKGLSMKNFRMLSLHVTAQCLCPALLIEHIALNYYDCVAFEAEMIEL